MKRTITIAAVGDILMWQPQIDSAKVPGKDRYAFDPMFRAVAPHLRRADLAIGNLETTLSGRESRYQRKNPKTGWPMFNCPDELAGALKRAGFDVLTTANNHCMDRGERGLKRTLRVLDRHGIAHTGTFSSREAARRLLIKNVHGIRVGILAYTYGTNRIPVPKGRPWLVNRIRKEKIVRDIRALKAQGADLVVVCLHFGQEFHRHPTAGQKALVDSLFRQGADVVLGAHPHVLQPMRKKTVRRHDGTRRDAFVIYSLGNFVSDLMRKDRRTLVGVILLLKVEKDGSNTRIAAVRTIPTWVLRRKAGEKTVFRVIPARTQSRHTTPSLSAAERRSLAQARTIASRLLSG